MATQANPRPQNHLPTLTDAERALFRSVINCLSVFMDAAFLHRQSREGEIDLTLYSRTLTRLIEVTDGGRLPKVHDGMVKALRDHIGEARLEALVSEGNKGMNWIIRCEEARRSTPDPFSQPETGK